MWWCRCAEVGRPQNLTVFNKVTTNFLDTQQNKENIYLSYQHYFLTNVSNFLDICVGSKKNVCIFANILQSILKKITVILSKKKDSMKSL